jgi:hypothetical protein
MVSRPWMRHQGTEWSRLRTGLVRWSCLLRDAMLIAYRYYWATKTHSFPVGQIRIRVPRTFPFSTPLKLKTWDRKG